MVNVNDFLKQNDNAAFDAAIAARGADGVVVIPPRKSADGRDYWLLDRAILLPANTTVILQNCKLKLSDRCRDNFFRTANCGMGIEDVAPIENVHIKGEGCCLLEGADHPRASGDSSMTLAAPCPHEVEDLCRLGTWIPEERRTPETIEFWDIHGHSYGTDAGKAGESQKGDWRGIGILFANVTHFSISGLKIKESHGWAISLEACAKGRVEKIEFDARMSKMVDGLLQNMENQDGIDLRNGCHHITISDISGSTGDDVIALTAIADERHRKGGALCSTHVMSENWDKRERDIHDVIIRNVRAHSNHRFLVRLLSIGTHIYNVVIDGVTDTSPEEVSYRGILIGDKDMAYGSNLPDGVKNVTISNVIYNSDRYAIHVKGYLKDSTITNVISTRSAQPAILVDRENGLENVKISNIVAPEGVATLQQL